MKELLESAKAKLKELVEGAKEDKTSAPQKIDIKKKAVSKAMAKPVPKRKVEQGPKIIYRSDELPEYSSIVDIKKTLDLNPALESDYVILRSKKKDNVVFIVCVEEKAKLRIDNEFLQLRKRCSELGFEVYRLFTSKNILDITYAKTSDRKLKAKNKTDEGEYHRLFDSILRKAVLKGSSDIILSIEGGKPAKIKMRIKGKVKVDDELPTEKARSLASVAYTSLAESGAKDTTFNESKPQDGIINRIIDGQEVSVRLATIPAHPSGFDMTLRVMPVGSAQKEKPLGELGYNHLQTELIKYAQTIPVGVIVIAGVTGSGKTTTLGTIIRGILRKSNAEKRIITIEDPPEHRIEDATQVPVVRANQDTKEKSPFNAAMRASLRSDPDILMPGEIRDEESASLMVDATLSGHQVYTTVHAPSMFDILIRLREIGIKNSVLGSSSFLSALIYQSLVRTVCPHCAIKYEDFRNDIKNVGMLDTFERIEKTVSSKDLKNIKFHNEDGCEECNFEGISGREVIAEVMVPDRKMKQLFMQGKDEEAEQYYKKAGGKFIVDHGIEKLIEGKVDIRDLEDKVGRIDMSDTPLDEMLKKFNGSNEITEKVESASLKSSLSRTKKESAEVVSFDGAKSDE